MANTIKNFLVGVGLDTKDFEKGEKSVSNGLGRFRALAGFAGAAMTTAFAVTGGASIAAGNRIDKFALSTEKLNTSAGFVYDLGNAFSVAGGEAADAIATIDSLESKLAEYNLAGGFPLEQSVLAGVDAQALLQAEDGGEAFRMLGDMVKDMNKEQRRFIQDEFGFSDVAMRMLGGGTEGIDRDMAEVANRAEITQEAIEASREYNRQIGLVNTSMKGFSDTLAANFLPVFNNVLGSVNDFLDGRDSDPESPSRLPGEEAPSAWDSMIDKSIFGKDGEERRQEHRDSWGNVTDSVGGWVSDRRSQAIQRRIEYRESIDSQEAIQATPEYSIINNNSSERMTLPTQQINTNLEAKLMIDGREIDTRVVDVIERRERATVEDMQSTTVR